jgi:hypothetical protein
VEVKQVTGMTKGRNVGGAVCRDGERQREVGNAGKKEKWCSSLVVSRWLGGLLNAGRESPKMYGVSDPRRVWES